MQTAALNRLSVKQMLVSPFQQLQRGPAATISPVYELFLMSFGGKILTITTSMRRRMVCFHFSGSSPCLEFKASQVMPSYSLFTSSEFGGLKLVHLRCSRLPHMPYMPFHFWQNQGLRILIFFGVPLGRQSDSPLQRIQDWGNSCALSDHHSQSTC